MLKEKEEKHYCLDKSRLEDIFIREVFALQNDLYYKFFENKTNRWYFDISYKPYQIPSGDCYSIRKVGENKLFVFLVDAMGKGLSASFTSIMSSTFINYITDTQTQKGKFDLEYTIKKYHRFIKKSIFEDEIISVSFFVFDFFENRVEYASFAMPPVLMCLKDKSVTKLKANNLPLSKYNLEINISEHSLEEVVKLLIYSDGLNESVTKDMHMYKKYLENDFVNKANYKEFLSIAQTRVGDFDDDMTFLYIEKEICDKCVSCDITLKSRQNELQKAADKMSGFFLNNGLSLENEIRLNNAFNEMLLNAYEHGNLGISYKQKNRHMEEGTFERLIEKLEEKYRHKKIYIKLSVKEEKDFKIFKIEIEDEGNGFDTNIMRNKFLKKGSFSGCGLIMTSKMVDAFYYNDKGNKVVMKKIQKKEK